MHTVFAHGQGLKLFLRDRVLRVPWHNLVLRRLELGAKTKFNVSGSELPIIGASILQQQLAGLHDQMHKSM